MLRQLPILLLAFVITAAADHPALAKISGQPAQSDHEIVPLALQYRLQALQAIEHGYEHGYSCQTLDELLSCCPWVTQPHQARFELPPSDSLYRYLSLRL